MLPSPEIPSIDFLLSTLNFLSNETLGEEKLYQI